RLVCPAPPGGITDIGARMVANYLQSRWGQPVVVDNRAGAGGVIGTQEFLRLPADRHTLLIGNVGPQATAYTLFRNLPYRAEQLAPLSGIIRGPNILVVHPSVPVRTVPEFVAWLRANPGRASYASSGNGQSPHLSGVWFHQLTGTQATHVPYRGSAPAMTDLLAGNVQFMFENLIAASEAVQAGRLRALAVTTTTRSPLLPEVPAMRETMPELAAYDVSTWVGAFAHAGTPPEVMAAYNSALREMLSLPESVTALQRRGSEAHVTTVAEFEAFVSREIAKWREVVSREGLVVEMN
ncbi:MAG TPA: tripartite tricarboxylate transporter substrate binding protein, partial [Acetobacteraceae bacterium]|nr:tripartite tricarboxylate transporter substrate binding protein [Acetobacteraceae bacterium]